MERIDVAGTDSMSLAAPGAFVARRAFGARQGAPLGALIAIVELQIHNVINVYLISVCASCLSFISCDIFTIFQCFFPFSVFRLVYFEG